MIVGIGVDICQVDRVEAMLRRRPGMLGRLFTDQEAHRPDGTLRTPASLAARFAAKEALAKALGSPGGMVWVDAEVHSGPDGRPVFETRGTVAALMERLGVRRIQLSLSHEAGMAAAFVVCEGES
ncbi:holo-ACP synthase [Brooklawnia cerclae]|uniref:Holo-[acyl-carrier-protein] synthase n=1 Tax=Brooklawnia cerclae TaxID=349934 RepID=A0ABX0SBW6_9ACTN|nr:holo-ACP synthase [Brooklawnia cerclae]NIH55879.1 holo-[acyl-carrier protein] synthase [Brooklawnia cerclae]